MHLRLALLPVLLVGTLLVGACGSDAEPAATDPAGDIDRSPQPPTPEAADELVGLSEPVASEIAVDRGWDVRVTERDGEPLPVTMDFVENRVNFSVDDGIVTSATFG